MRIKWLVAVAVIALCASCNLPKPNRQLIGGIVNEIDGNGKSGGERPQGMQAGKDDAYADAGYEIPAPLNDRPEQILRRTGFTVSYNKELRLPNWVAWHLTANHTGGPYSRNGIAFQEDEDVPKPRADTYDYQRSGYDRGHMCPSGDNKWSGEAQRQCFLLTNICPQGHKLNSGDWRVLEEQCRTWAGDYGDIYIACGPMLSGSKHKRIGKHKVTVPDGFYKVVLTLKPNPRALGFVFSNTDDDQDFRQRVVSVDKVEALTGIDFFASLDDKLENKVEATANIDEWR